MLLTGNSRRGALAYEVDLLDDDDLGTATHAKGQAAGGGAAAAAKQKAAATAAASREETLLESLFGSKLYAWKSAEEIQEVQTNTALKDVKVVGVYFSASWW